MSVSGPSPLGTLMVQRVEGALGVSGSQQSNIATGARPDAVSQPGQPEKNDAVKNPPPKGEEGARQPPQGRQGALAALARNDPEIAKLLASRNAPMTSYTASAPTSLGQAAKTILALLQQFPDARPMVTGRAPLFPAAPGQGQPASSAGSQAGATTPQPGAAGPQSGAAAGPRAAAPTASAPLSSGTPAQPAAAQATASAPGTPAPAFSGLAGQFAQALSQAMQGSGLFYESHLRELAFGQRTAEQLRSEPQAQAGREAASNAGTGNTTRADADASRPAQSGQMNQPSSASAQASQSGAHTQASAQPAGALLGLDPSTHMLVRQQLEALANQAFAWQGEAWPGSEMEWEVQRREPQGGVEEAESWSTRLKLNLPGLGEVSARLSLSNSQLVMHLAAPDSADIIADHTALLRERLSAHGLQLNQLTISRDSEQPEGDER